MSKLYSSHKQQQGMSLLVVLILLVVMSILGVAVMRSSSMQERMAANLRDRRLATQAAEAALATAVTNLKGMAKFRTTAPVAQDCTDYGAVSYTHLFPVVMGVTRTTLTISTSVSMAYMTRHCSFSLDDL